MAVALYAAFLLWTTRLGRQPPHGLDPRQKTLIALSAAGIWLTVFTLVDLAFTRVGAQGISSLQGRYMIPLTPLIFLLLSPRPAPVPRQRRWAVAGFSACFCAYVAIVLARRFYSA